MSRSIFPEGVDQFTELFDLPFDKLSSANRLTALKMKEKLTNEEQNEVTMLSSELHDYLITPETWNKFQDSLQAVQQFFYDNVQGWLTNKQNIWNSYIRNFKSVGVWAVGTSYKFQNIVVAKNGNAYICKVDHVASTANEPKGDGQGNDQWQKISNKGDTGDAGLSLILKGDWNSATSYNMGDAVQFGRDLYKSPVVYYALRDNVGKSPNSNSSDWALYDKLFVGASLPNGYGAGMHFIKIIE